MIISYRFIVCHTVCILMSELNVQYHTNPMPRYNADSCANDRPLLHTFYHNHIETK